MSEQRQSRWYSSPLPGGIKFGLLLAAIGFVFGADAVLGFLKSFGEFLLSILLGCAVWFAIFGSMNWIFDHFARRSGTDAAAAAMFAYLFLGLPFIVWVTGLLIEWTSQSF